MLSLSVLGNGADADNGNGYRQKRRPADGRHSPSAYTNKMIRFGKTDNKGSFSIEANADSYLEVSMLGFKKLRINSLSDKEPMRIVMQEEAVALKEVTVKASKVREHGDTLTYNVATFADQNDRNIGDVLSRIPGFEVNKQNGQIKYEGKPISKFYIEGWICWATNTA